MICGELGLKPGRTRHRDVPTLLLFYRKEQPPRWPGPCLSPLSSPVAVFRPAPTSACIRTPFPIRVFCFCSFLCPGTYFHPPTPIPVSRGGSPSNGIWWKLFPAPQAESITLSFLSKHSTSPLLEHPSYCDLNVSSLLIQHKAPRCLMAGTLSDPALWRFASALNA